MGSLRILSIAAVTVGLIFGAGERSFTTWTAYLGGPDSSQYTALKQINKSNVKQLQVAWTYATGDKGNYLFNPIVIDGVMYVLAKNHSIIALEAATGKELWIHPNEGAVGVRGINYWESKGRSDRRLLYINAGFLTEIDARTGQTIQSFGDNGRTDLRVGLDRDISKVRPLQTNNPGRVFENLIIIPLPAGGAQYDAIPADIHAYDVRTGKLVWVFHTIPHPGEFGYDTWPKDAWQTAGGVHNWNEMTVDESGASPTSLWERPATISTAPTAKATICSATACWLWTRAPASACGISKSSITIFGTTIYRPRLSSSRFVTMESWLTWLPSPPNRDFCSCSIA